MIVVVCPGQGSQTPGFLAPWLAQPSFADRLAGLSDAAGIDLAGHGTESDADSWTIAAHEPSPGHFRAIAV